MLGVVGFLASSCGDPAPLRVTPSGDLTLLGKPFRGAGVNVYDLFTRSLAVPVRTNADVVLRLLAHSGTPFARFSGSGYWPVDWGLWRTNRAEHWVRLDTVVAAAERRGVGLIPSIFWNPPTISDLAGESFNAWGEPGSRTWGLAREYLAEVVGRYRKSPAIWAWEFGNEMNLPADLPNAVDHRPPTVPELGTPAHRGAGDDITHDQMRSALQEFGRVVRRLDPDRPILSGNAFPRVSAWRQWKEKSWATDSPEQFDEMLLGDNPDPLSMVSGRLYDAADLRRLPAAVAAGRRAGKPLFIGEFGVAGAPTTDGLLRFREELAAIENSHVALAALWVFDFDGQANDWNVTASNFRSPYWDLFVEWRRTRGESLRRR